MRFLRVILALLVAASLATLSTTTAEASSPLAGKSCKKAGQVTVRAGVTYTCVRSGHRRVWRRVATSFGPASSPAAKACVAAKGDNASVLSKPASATQNKNVLIAQDNLWFHGLDANSAFVAWDGSGSRTSPFEPAMGFYDTSSRAVSEATIAMAADHGIDALSQEWIAPLGEPGSLEGPMDDAFLAARNLCRIRWAIFDDLNLHLNWKYPETYGSQPPNFDDSRVRALFVSDMEHFATKYFGGAQYLKVDGRPVVEIWGTWNFRGSIENLESTVLAARAAVSGLGYDVYMVGDEETASGVDARRVALWDATTSFIPMLMGGNPYAGRNNGTAGLGDATAFVDGANRRWVNGLGGVKVLGRGDPVAFQPGFAPQYDDTMFRAVNGIPGPTSLLAMSAGEIRRMAEVSMAAAQPIGNTGRNLIWIGTWNNYPESTQIEATQPGNGYPGGNTGYDILDVLGEVFGKSVFGS